MCWRGQWKFLRKEGCHESKKWRKNYYLGARSEASLGVNARRWGAGSGAPVRGERDPGWGLEGWRKVKVGCDFLKDLLGGGLKAGLSELGAEGRPGRAGRSVALDLLGLQRCRVSPGRAPGSTGALGPACGGCTLAVLAMSSVTTPFP